MVATETKEKTDPLVTWLLKHDLPCIKLAGTWGLVSNEPRDSTINDLGRSAIRPQSSHCKENALNYLLLVLSETHTHRAQARTGKWYLLVIPRGDSRTLGGSGSGWEREGQGFGRTWLRVKSARSPASPPPCWT